MHEAFVGDIRLKITMIDHDSILTRGGASGWLLGLNQ